MENIEDFVGTRRMENNDGVKNVMLGKISIQIMDDLGCLPPASLKNPIPKVHNLLCKVNKEAYEPQFVAIGPYHHYNNKRQYLSYMEMQKLHYLDQMLKRKGENKVDRYVQALSKIEVEARQQYAEHVDLTPEEFIKMMLLDGCFINEYFRKYSRRCEYEDDPLFHVPWMELSIRRDLLLLENQLPFLVLRKLHYLIGNEQHHFTNLAWNFITEGTRCELLECDCKHLLDLQYQKIIPRLPPIQFSYLPIEHIIVRHSMLSAIELIEHGIKFKAVKNDDMFEIKFNKGTLEIPTIKVEDHTEVLFRNLVAYEQHRQGQDGEIKYVTDYVTFINCLVNTPNDVKLLRQMKIIDNYLGSDEVVSTMFNKMGDYVSFNEWNFYYSRIFSEVNEHCEKKRNRWIATLRRDYFNTPWASISFVAAFILLIATIIQTVGTMLSII